MFLCLPRNHLEVGLVSLHSSDASATAEREHSNEIFFNGMNVRIKMYRTFI